MRALVWANSVGAAVFGALVPVVAWLVGTAAAVAEMTGLPGPDVAVMFVTAPMFVLAVTALFVAVAMVERDRQTTASPRGAGDATA